MSDCVNLTKEFGNRFQVGFDPAWRQVPKDERGPCLMMLQSRLGTIFPHGDRLLAVEVAGHPSIRRKLDNLDCCRRHQTGERFGCWLFPVECFEQVAAIAKPRRKRAWSDEQRQEAAERLKANLKKPDESREDPPISEAG